MSVLRVGTIVRIEDFFERITWHFKESMIELILSDLVGYRDGYILVDWYGIGYFKWVGYFK